MEKLSSIFSAFSHSGAELQLDELFIIIFIALVIFALLIGYLLGRKVTSSQKSEKKLEKAKKKQEAKDAKLADKAKKQEEKELAKKQKNRVETVLLDPDDEGQSSSMPIIPEHNTTTFIQGRSENSPEARPVVTVPPRKGEAVKRPPESKEELKAYAEKEAKLRQKAEEEKLKVDKEAERAAAVQARVTAKVQQEPAPVEEAPKKKGLFARKAKEEKPKVEAAPVAEPVPAPVEAPAPAPVPEPTPEPAPVKEKANKKESKLSKKQQKKKDLEELNNTVQVEADPNAEPITAEEMAKRLEAIVGGPSKPAVSLNAEVPEEPKVEETPVGALETTSLSKHNDNWVLEEMSRLNADAEKKEAEREEAQLPFAAFGAGIESSADDIELSSRQKKKILQKEAEEEKKEEEKKKPGFSLFGKKAQEEAAIEEEDDFEGWQEEIPDSLAGFGFSAAPAIKPEEEEKK